MAITVSTHSLRFNKIHPGFDNSYGYQYNKSSCCTGQGWNNQGHPRHSHSQQGIWVSLGHPHTHKSPVRTPKFRRVIPENVNFKHMIDSFSPQYNSHEIVQGYYALFQ